MEEREQLQRWERVKIGQEEVGDTVSSLMCSQGRGGLGFSSGEHLCPKGYLDELQGFCLFLPLFQRGERATAERTDTKKYFLIL